jgi:hypothetical protein
MVVGFIIGTFIVLIKGQVLEMLEILAENTYAL